MRSLPILFAAALLVAGQGAHAPGHASHPEAPCVAMGGLRQLQFVPNRGQWHAGVRYAVIGDTTGWLHDDGFTLRLERWTPTGDGPGASLREQSGAVVRTRFLDASTSGFAAEQPLPAVHNFFLGSDPARWCAAVPSFGVVTAQHVLSGVDVRYRALPAGRPGPFEYDLLLAPGADLTRFVARCEGVEALAIDTAGRLCATVRTPDGLQELVQEAPIAWQETANGPAPLRVAFRLVDATSYGFVAADLDPALAAIVDPGVVWGTFLGGGQTDRINAMRWVPGNGVFVAGWAGSLDFPTTVGAYRTTGGADGFVAKLADNGATLQYATYLGGAAGEEIRGLDLGPGDTPVVVGYTASANFPVTAGAPQPTYGGAGPFLAIGDAFATRLNTSGSALQWSTYLGGVIDDVAEGVRVDAVGNAAVVGWTSSANFPSTPGSFQPTPGGFPGITTDGFLTRIAADGLSLGFSTFLGGLLSEQLLAVDRDPGTGDWLVAGWTVGNDLPVTLGAYRPSNAGGIDGLVARFSPNGATANFVTYLGGLQDDALLAVRGTNDGSVWVGGSASSINYPVTLNAPQQVLSGTSDGVVSRLAANGQSLLFSTLLGGTGPEKVRAVDVSAVGVLVVGEAGDGFPVTAGAPQSLFAGGMIDAFATLLTNGGTTIAWSSYFGGVGQDAFGSVDLTDGGLAVVAGWSYSPDFPIDPSAYSDTLRGSEDGIVLKLDLVSTLGLGFTVAPATAVPSGPQPVAPGEVRLLDATVANTAARDLLLESVRLLVAGAGDTPLAATNVRVYATSTASPGQRQLLAGPLALLGDDREHELPLGSLLLPIGASARVEVVADLVAAPNGRTVEVAAAVCDDAAWTVRVPGAGTGPSVRLDGSGRLDGAQFVVGSLAGDTDGDGVATVVDLRRRLANLGAADLGADSDGDGVTTMADVALLRDQLLGRATFLAAPAQVSRGGWLTLRGVLPNDASVQASLGGRALTVGRVTAREITLRVEANQALGVQELLVTVAGRPFAAQLLTVQ